MSAVLSRPYAAPSFEWEAEWEQEFRTADLAAPVRAAFNMGALGWPLAVQRAIEAGVRDANDLADMVFFMHHPERLRGGVGQPLQKSDAAFDKLRNEWLAWRTLIQPMLKKPAGSSPAPSTASESAPLRFGVPGGKIGSPFDNFRNTRYHLGIDVSPYSGRNGGAEDPRRGLPVYLTLKSRIAKRDLDTARITRDQEKPAPKGLGLASRGDATLASVQVLKTFTHATPDSGYGSVVTFKCVYDYQKSDGAPAKFTLFIEYWHLITASTMPYPGTGSKITQEQWRAAGKAHRIGFGPRIVKGKTFTPGEASSAPPILIGYLGATRWPHVHIQIAFAAGDTKTTVPTRPRVDPALAVN